MSHRLIIANSTVITETGHHEVICCHAFNLLKTYSARFNGILQGTKNLSQNPNSIGYQISGILPPSFEPELSQDLHNPGRRQARTIRIERAASVRAWAHQRTDSIEYCHHVQLDGYSLITQSIRFNNQEKTQGDDITKVN